MMPVSRSLAPTAIRSEPILPGRLLLTSVPLDLGSSLELLKVPDFRAGSDAVQAFDRCVTAAPPPTHGLVIVGGDWNSPSGGGGCMSATDAKGRTVVAPHAEPPGMRRPIASTHAARTGTLAGLVAA